MDTTAAEVLHLIPGDAPTYTGTLGQRLRAARNHSGLSQRNLAAAVGVTYQTIQHWEADRALFAVGHMPVIEDTLGLEPGRVGSWVRYSPLAADTLDPAIPGLLYLVPPLHDEPAAA